MSFRTLSLACAVLALVALGCMSAEERIANHLERARVYADSSQPEKALVELQSALKLDPRSAEINFRIGEQLTSMERYADAIFFYEEAHRIDPARDDAKLGIALIVRLSDTDRAEKLVDEVLAHAASARAHILRSDVHLARANPEGALASATAALELEPENVLAVLQVGVAHKAFLAYADKTKQPVPEGAFEAAVAAFASASELAKQQGGPDGLDSYIRAVVERAEVLTRWRGHGPEVVALYKDAYEQVKDVPVLARRLIGSVAPAARRAKDHALVVWAIERAVELEPWNYEAWVELAERTAKANGDAVVVLDRMIAARPDASRSYTTYADFLADHGQRQEAIDFLKKAPADLERPEALLAGLAILHLRANQKDEAAKVIERLRKEHPDSAQTYFAEAMLANYEGRAADAVRALEQWTSREESENGFGMLAQARLRAGNPRDALDAVDRALALAPRPRPDYQRMRGRILVLLGDNEAAIQAFARSRRYGGRIPVDFLPDLAQALYARGDEEAARRALDRALAGERPPPAALMLFARKEAKNDPRAARAALERGAKLYPHPPSFEERLISLDLASGAKDAAMARAEAMAAAQPESVPAQVTLARALSAVGRTDEAVRQAELIHQRWPAQPGVAEVYLEVLTAAGRGDEAFQALSEQRAAGTLAPQARVLLARLHVLRGEDVQAIELLRSVLGDQADNALAQNDLAYLLARRGEDLEGATELAQEARANRPDSPEIADTLGYVYLRRELAEAALVQFEAALELSEPSSTRWAIAQYHRALALRALGRQADAVAAIEQALASGADFAEAQEAHRVLAELSAAQPGPTGS